MLCPLNQLLPILTLPKLPIPNPMPLPHRRHRRIIRPALDILPQHIQTMQHVLAGNHLLLPRMRNQRVQVCSPYVLETVHVVEGFDEVETPGCVPGKGD
jgi:hypothetical protein